MGSWGGWHSPTLGARSLAKELAHLALWVLVAWCRGAGLGRWVRNESRSAWKYLGRKIGMNSDAKWGSAGPVRDVVSGGG